MMRVNVAFNSHLHSIAWSIDLKDLGLPFRKFCILWSASMALPAGGAVSPLTDIEIPQLETRMNLNRPSPTFYDVYGHQTYGGWYQHVARCVHCDRTTNTVANQNDRGRSLTVAGSNHIGYVT